jgi:protein TonB
MNWPDDEFEAFLRQFRPRAPKALPTYRWRVIALAAAAVIIAAIVIPSRYGWREPASTVPTATPSAAPSGSPGTGGDVDGNFKEEIQLDPSADRALRGGNTPAAVSRTPARSAENDVKRLDAPPQRDATSASGNNDQRLKVGGAILPPTKIFDVKPIYPPEAQDARIEGVVIVGAVIGEDGSVVETWILRSIPELDQAAMDAVSQWLFEPTLLNGEPIEIEMTATINFTLQ